MNEFIAFIAILLHMSIVKQKRLIDYWDNVKFGSEFIKNLMKFNHFKLIYQSIHLIDEDDAAAMGISKCGNAKYDKNYKITSYINAILLASQRIHRPKARLTIDEMMAQFAVCILSL